MKIAHIFLALFLFLGLTSCSLNDDDIIDVTEHETKTTQPPSDEAGEEDEIEPIK